ncbi:L-lactate permease [Macrococcoides canis]|uniref:L-lactate permease n=1 Tax=Macrococcoides canis TaxID=1855823 RepID=UPI001AEC287C|nr:L-lactate permease [Macrococcus canis]QTQ07822.1 L-lactate permease [Macrococcus canis]
MSLLIAIFPILLIFLLLFIVKYSAFKSGVITLTSTLLLVLSGSSKFHLSIQELLDALIKSTLISSIAAYVMFFGILLFHLMNESDKISEISEEFKRLTDHQVLQVIILVLGISPLIESTSGFGTAFLVVAPILISLGIERNKSALIGILSLLAVPWGALSTGTVIGSRLVNVDLNAIGFISAIISSATICYFLLVALYILDGFNTIINNKVLIFKFLITFITSNIVFNYWINVELAGVFSSLVVIALGLFLIKKEIRHYYEINKLIKLMMPYILLTLLVLITRVVPGISDFLLHNIVIELQSFNFTLPLLYSPGFWILIICLYSIIIFKINVSAIRNSVHKTIRQWTLFIVTTSLFIMLAQIMDYSEMNDEISSVLGNIFGKYYLLFSILIGSLGGFLTGSNTGANAMFMKLQVQTANTIDIDTKLIAGVQNVSASNATMTTPSRIRLASEICDVKNEENMLMNTLIKILIGAILLTFIISVWIILFI